MNIGIAYKPNVPFYLRRWRNKICTEGRAFAHRANAQPTGDILLPPRKTVSSIQMTRCATNFTSSPLVKMAAKPASLAAALGATQATPAPASNPRRHASKTSYPS